MLLNPTTSVMGDLLGSGFYRTENFLFWLKYQHTCPYPITLMQDSYENQQIIQLSYFLDTCLCEYVSMLCGTTALRSSTT